MPLTNQIISFNIPNSKDICLVVAENVKVLRLQLSLTQKGLAQRADVNLATYRKFERTGEISLFNLSKISIALKSSEDISSLFTKVQYQNIDEIIEGQQPTRKRGTKN